MRSKLIIVLIFLIPSTLTFGQITITGSILSEEDSTGLPGVSIIEFGTSNSVLADLNGDYKITVSDSASFLEFSFVGYVTRKVPINGQTVINTSLKPYIIYEAFDQKIGVYLQSGVVNIPFGARFYYITPVVDPLSVGFQVDYLTDFELNEKLSASLSLSRYRIIIADWYIYNSVNLNYRKFSISNTIDLNSYSIENYARVNSQKIILGLSKFQFSHDNKDSSTKYGLIAGFEKEFQKLNYLTLTSKLGIYKETIEYDLRIDIPIKRVNTFINLNKIDDYQEIMIGIGFKTYYYYRYQKNANKY
ncbi:carboxypeptidase-like regulatory domain-containing protein [Marinifilum fragile]|uniref:carboxypeptidase-like regulatory domain-containing protein n=1 Tax=Marinifilum fragile TaxID=570161 RepID=UPI002AA8FE66|nr:carboxypeptidase-like regulatory domain-containing protein [Marinifilum fragile]